MNKKDMKSTEELSRRIFLENSFSVAQKFIRSRYVFKSHEQKTANHYYHRKQTNGEEKHACGGNFSFFNKKSTRYRINKKKQTS